MTARAVMIQGTSFVADNRTRVTVWYRVLYRREDNAVTADGGEIGGVPAA